MTDLRKIVLGALEASLHGAGAFRLLHRHLSPGSISVLMYHGLTQEPLSIADPCFISVATFQRQMEYLARNFEMVHVDEAFEVLHRTSSRPRACITFDDGFASVEELAWPILERHRIPATVYLVTDLIGTAETVWFARLHQAICESAFSQISYGSQNFSLRGTTARAEASGSLQALLKLLPRGKFLPALERVLSQLGFPPESRPKPWSPFRIMSQEQVQRMSRDGLVRFGAHTASHQILTRTAPQDAQREIVSSIRAVADLVDYPSRSFAYPNGGPDDFDGVAIDALRRAGIPYALTTISGPFTRAGSPYAIPRYNVADVRLARFARMIHHTGNAIRGLKLFAAED